MFVLPQKSNKAKKIFFAVLCFTLFGLAQKSLAADYFVDKDSVGGACSNSYVGTIEQPWCSLARANSIAQAGDTIFIREGIYYESINPSFSGSAGNPITFRAYNGEFVVIDGSMQISGWTLDSGNRYYADITFTPNASFDTAGYGCAGNNGGLVLQNGAKMNYCMAPTVNDVDSEGEYFMDDSAGCSVGFPCRLYVYARNLGNGYDPNNYEMRVGRLRKGVDLDGGEDYITIDGLEIRRVQDNGIHSTGATNLEVRNSKFYGNYITGIYLTSASNGMVLENSEFWDNGHAGIELDNSDNHIIRKNLFKKIDLGDGHGGNAAHISINIDPNTFDNTLIENNLFYETASDYLGPVWSLRIAGDNNQVLNNTFYRSADAMMFAIGMMDGSNLTVRNNVVYDASGPEGVFPSIIYFQPAAVLDGGHSVSNNIFYSSISSTAKFHWNGINYNSLAAWETASGQSGNLTSDPLFVNLGSRDFHLSLGSPAINAGSNSGVTTDYEGNARPQGLAYDIGAYEYVSEADVTAPAAPSGLSVN